jgi:hypothetical protein
MICAATGGLPRGSICPRCCSWFRRLQRGEGQGCSWRDRAAGTEQGARDLLERRQQAQCIRKLVTIPHSFELLKHNCFGVHLCAAPTLLHRPPRSSAIDLFLKLFMTLDGVGQIRVTSNAGLQGPGRRAVRDPSDGGHGVGKRAVAVRERQGGAAAALSLSAAARRFRCVDLHVSPAQRSSTQTMRRARRMTRTGRAGRAVTK